MHRHATFAEATASASFGWAHGASPEKLRKETEGLDFLAENGLELDLGAYMALWRKRMWGEPRPLARVSAEFGGGQAAAALLVLSDLVKRFKPRAGLDFLETAEAVVRREGGVWVDEGRYRFADGTGIELREHIVGCDGPTVERFFEVNLKALQERFRRV